MKTNLDKHFKAHTESEKEGVWFKISDQTAFLVKRFSASNPAIRIALAKHFRPYARQIEMGTLDYQIELEITVKVFVNSCLMNWRGVEIDGKIAEFSKPLAIEFFMSLPELFATIQEYASDFKNYREELEETGKS